MLKVHIPATANLRKERIAAWIPGSRDRSKLFSLPHALVEVMRLGVLSRDRRYMFIRNSKAACTSVTQAIHFWETGSVAGKGVHSSPNLIIGRSNYNILSDALMDPDIFRFTFVRDPEKRAVSAFANFFLDNTHRQRKPHVKPMKALGYREDASPESNFDAFLRYIAECLAENPVSMDSHFRTQYFNIRPDIVRYDRICRVENLHQDLAGIADTLGLPKLPDQLETRHNASRIRFEPNLTQKSELRRLYAIDYCNFGYDIRHDVVI